LVEDRADAVWLARFRLIGGRCWPELAGQGPEPGSLEIKAMHGLSAMDAAIVAAARALGAGNLSLKT